MISSRKLSSTMFLAVSAAVIAAGCTGAITSRPRAIGTGKLHPIDAAKVLDDHGIQINLVAGLIGNTSKAFQIQIFASKAEASSSYKLDASGSYSVTPEDPGFLVCNLILSEPSGKRPPAELKPASTALEHTCTNKGKGFSEIYNAITNIKGNINYLDVSPREPLSEPMQIVFFPDSKSRDKHVQEYDKPREPIVPIFPMGKMTMLSLKVCSNAVLQHPSQDNIGEQKIADALNKVCK